MKMRCEEILELGFGGWNLGVRGWGFSEKERRGYIIGRCAVCLVFGFRVCGLGFVVLLSEDETRGDVRQVCVVCGGV